MAKLIGKLLGLLIIVVSLGLGWLWQKIDYFTDAPIHLATDSIEYEIKPGSSLTKVSKQLVEQGLIESSSDFLWMIRLNDLSSNVHAGLYQIPSGITPKELLLMFTTGKVKQYSFTIVEGWTFRQLLTALAGMPKIKPLLKGKSNAEIIAALGLDETHLEGFFLPDTYKFPAGTTDIEFLQRAYKAMQTVLATEWMQRDMNSPLKSAYEALILASIVERETAVASERATIAGVFTRRLQKKMRLQTDPTIIYGLGDDFNGNLKKKHLLDASNPYNTYRIRGLTPTPIALPSADAIKAALHPAPGKQLYFVAKGDGSHYFSATLEEHNTAVEKYQIKKRKSNYRSTPETKDQRS